VTADVISSDRFLLKILDRAVSLQDIQFHARNLRALQCIYDDSIVIKFFDKSFLADLDKFLGEFPKKEEEIQQHLHAHEGLLKKIRRYFKMLRYSEDQKSDVSQKLTQLIRESAKENRCNTAVLYKDTLKTNFKLLMETELYLRARYSGQIKSVDFESMRPSIELFVDSLDKQFVHEYFW
jgi:hypothetical protein